MRGAIPPLPHFVFMAWFLIVHRSNSTLLYDEIFSGYQPGQMVERRKKTNVSKTISVLVLRVLA
jgi:hypothetical protein